MCAQGKKWVREFELNTHFFLVGWKLGFHPWPHPGDLGHVGADGPSKNRFQLHEQVALATCATIYHRSKLWVGGEDTCAHQKNMRRMRKLTGTCRVALINKNWYYCVWYRAINWIYGRNARICHDCLDSSFKLTMLPDCITCYHNVAR